jgi:hypothetical protein
MKRAFGRAGGAVALLALTVPCHYGCESGPYMGGRCETFEDCHSSSQAVPGTLCVEESCVCEEPALVICCAPGDAAPGCPLACRPCDACNPATLDANDRARCGVKSCDADDTCMSAPDPRCGAGKCVDHVCTLAITPGPVPGNAQPKGDCEHLECTQDGHVIHVDDPYDAYDDGKECTVDLCNHGTSINTPLLSLVCPVTGVGRCHEGECVQCVAKDPTANDCPGGQACDGVLCVPPHCIDSDFDPGQGEMARNCGGPCRPCEVGAPCRVGSDCETGSCNGFSCQVPTCEDGVQNGKETGIDCGGSPCPLCPKGAGCKAGKDCVSGVCWAGRCE